MLLHGRYSLLHLVLVKLAQQCMAAHHTAPVQSQQARFQDFTAIYINPGGISICTAETFLALFSFFTGQRRAAALRTDRE